MPQLVALHLPPGPEFVDALQRAWDDGNAVLPVDYRLPAPAVAALFEALRPAQLISGEGTVSLGGARPVETGDALVVATSGTTGEPRGVILTHAAVRASAEATSDRLAVEPESDCWVACLPLAHIGGLSVITRALLTGTPYRILARFDPAEVEREATNGATLISLVATALGRTDTSGYCTVLLGGAAPPGQVPDNVVTTYGMTETGSGVVYDGIPLDGVELRIGDGTTGAVGEVLVRGPMLLRCYRHGTDPRIDGSWFPTGDAGSLDTNGTLSVSGRMAEVIVSGAEKIWPVAVEGVLANHPDVAEVAIWKRTDPEWGERVVAWIVPRDSAQIPTLASLRSWVSESLSPWAAPKELVVVDQLPRTSSGKVQRRLLH